ncbi:MAG: metallophosphoesterase [Merdibacter sp.]|nr:metallophosphoesterase [Merdibacter sp.]
MSSEKVNTPMRAVLISDQHDHIFRDDNEELIERILELEPDVVFMDGDMLNADSDDISWLLSEIERLSAKVPVYYALGNHELAYMAAHPDLITQLEEAGAIVLDEQYVDVEIAGNAVRIGGFYDYAFSRTDAKTTADTMDAQDHAFLSDFCDTLRLKIMLSHRPDSFVFSDASAIWQIDYVLCGHNHGGQVRLPFLGGVFGGDQGYFPPYEDGLHSFAVMNMIITRGLSSNPKILPRFNNLPEIVVLDFVS